MDNNPSLAVVRRSTPPSPAESHPKPSTADPDGAEADLLPAPTDSLADLSPDRLNEIQERLRACAYNAHHVVRAIISRMRQRGDLD